MKCYGKLNYDFLHAILLVLFLLFLMDNVEKPFLTKLSLNLAGAALVN